MSGSEITRRGILLVLSSPSGAGKTTITRELVAADPQLQISVSVTTRPPRKGEVDGKHYHFITRERFDAMVRHGELLEHASVFGHFYGTPRAPVEAALSAGRDIISDIDWQGTQQLAQTVRADLGVQSQGLGTRGKLDVYATYVLSDILSGAALQKGAVLRGGVSVDQVLAARFADETAQPSLVLGCEQPITGYHETNFSMAYSSHISWQSAESPVPNEVYPALAFDTLFENRGSLRNLSVLDRVREAAQTLSRQISSTDQQTLARDQASLDSAQNAARSNWLGRSNGSSRRRARSAAVSRGTKGSAK